VEVMNRLIAKNISINNDLYIKGQLTCEKLSVGGDVTCLSEAEINGEADIKGYLNCAFSVRFKGDATIGKFSQGTTLSVETKISIRNGGSFNQIIGNQITINGSCNCFQSLVAKKFTCTGTLYWGLAHKPHIPHDSVIGRVYPTGQQWAYWRERLGIHFERYKDVGEIFNNITPMIPELLQDPKWTETERWILESHLPKHVALN
jgi:cytoskeletal protein CcmA (bactofilin family)